MLLKDVPGQWVNVNMEQIIKIRSEIIYVSNFSDIQPDDLINNKIKGQDWSQIDAVKIKRYIKHLLVCIDGMLHVQKVILCLNGWGIFSNLIYSMIIK